jgi:hypothetical protein
MKLHRAGWMLAAVALAASLGILQAQDKGKAPAAKAPAKANPAAAKGKAAMPVQANLGQLMKGLLYVNSNVIFFAQSNDPKDVKPAAQASTATDPLQTSYGGWEAVENSALAIYEAANLLMLPGRKCANGRDVPINNPDWPRFVQGLRDAALESYKLAQKKDLDAMLDAADKISTACANCHDKWRDSAPNLAGRCM